MAHVVGEESQKSHTAEDVFMRPDYEEGVRWYEEF